MPETMVSHATEGLHGGDVPRVRARQDENRFDYRPMPVLAPVSLFLGVASFIALMGVAGLLLALVGIVISAAAVWTIRRSRGQYSGTALASIGLALSSVFFCSGASLLYRDYVAECPEGYLRVDFPAEISARKFVLEDGRLAIHPEVRRFEGQKVFLKGWMWNTQTSRDLDTFVLLKDNGECCMGGNPAAYDMMEVRMADGRPVDYMEGLLGIAGVLHMDPAGPSRGEAVYVLEAHQVDYAKTSF